MDLSVLDRLKWLQQQQQMVPPELLQILGPDHGREELKSVDGYWGYNNEELQSFRHFPEFRPDYDTIDGCISRTSSFHMEPVKNSEENRANKRKPQGKIEKREKKKKKIKAEDETESSNTEMSPQIQKLDYIHVRARRGEATDRHSLAERARREKISKKMKCLQDIVPGCSKVTGKAGMLDEIINYVQSLQQQVEFLSLKLSVLNSELELQSFPLQQQRSLNYSSINSNQTTFLDAKNQASSSWETHSQCLYNSLRTDSVPNFFSLK